MKNLLIKIVDISTKLNPWDKKLEVYKNGVDNLYPERVERFIGNSVTAKMASNRMFQYVIGAGYEGVKDAIVDNDSQLRLFDALDSIAQNLVDHQGFFIHVNYDITDGYKFSKFKPLPFGSCRIGQKDSKEYNGKILFCNNWEDAKKKDVQVLDVYNPNPKIIDSQILKAGGPNKYKGQIIYFNSTLTQDYPTARIDAVMNDCDSEAQSSIYKNRLLRRGFVGKTIFVTRPLIDDNIKPDIKDIETGRLKPNPDYARAVTEAEKLRKKIEGFLGAENADGAMHIEADFDGDEMSTWFKIEQVESKINPDLFKNVETGLRENILIAYNNLPLGLIKTTESMFGNSGEAIKQMKIDYWENTKYERELFVRQMNYLLPKIKTEYTQFNVKPLIVKDNGNDSNTY